MSTYIMFVREIRLKKKMTICKMYHFMELKILFKTLWTKF